MGLRNLAVIGAAMGLIIGSAQAAVGDVDNQAVAQLQGGIISNLAVTADDQPALMAAITNATAGFPLEVITAAVCPLPTTDLATIYGADQSAISGAQTTLSRSAVRSALTETCQVAQLALASYSATGGVPAGAAPGQAFGSGAVGAPGGGGGSGYTN